MPDIRITAPFFREIRVSREMRASGEIPKHTRYLTIPETFMNQRVRWIHHGLQPFSVPDLFDSKRAKENREQTFLIAEDAFSVVQQTTALALERAELRFAEIRGVLSESGEWAATAELIVQPSRESTCLLSLPPKSKLLQLSVGNQPVPKRQLKSHLWIIPLGLPSLPRQITVDYTSMVPIRDGTISLSAPKIVLGRQTLSASASHWQILPVGPIQLETAMIGYDQKATNYKQRGDEYRRAVVEEASSLAFQLSPREARQWFLPWQNRLEKSQISFPLMDTLLDRSAAATGQLDTNQPHNGMDRSAGRSGEPIDTQSPRHGDSIWHSMVAAFGKQSTPLQPDLLDETGEDLQESTNHAFPPPSNSSRRPQSQLMRYYAGGANGMLTVGITPFHARLLTYPWASPQWFIPRLTGMMVVGAGIWVMIVLTWRSWLRSLAQWFRARSCPPFLVVILGGGAWWIWLAPNAVGFAIMVLGLAAMGRTLYHAIAYRH